MPFRSRGGRTRKSKWLTSAIQRAAAERGLDSCSRLLWFALHNQLVTLHETLADEFLKHLVGRHLNTFLIPPEWKKFITGDQAVHHLVLALYNLERCCHKIWIRTILSTTTPPLKTGAEAATILCLEHIQNQNACEHPMTLPLSGSKLQRISKAIDA